MVEMEKEAGGACKVEKPGGGGLKVGRCGVAGNRVGERVIGNVMSGVGAWPVSLGVTLAPSGPRDF